MKVQGRRQRDKRTLISDVRGMCQSATLTINERSKELLAAGRNVYCLGFGQAPFPVPKVVKKALQANAHQKDYLPVRGLSDLRKAVAHFHNRSEGLDYAADEVLVGPGSKELLFILQMIHDGDLVITAPSWLSYGHQAQILGRKVHWISTQRQDEWRLTPEGLDDFCRRDPAKHRIVVLNYPNNPTGGSYSEDELKHLASVAKRHQLILLSDEIYGMTHHEGRHVSIARYYPEGTIVSGGLSKWCGAGGWRLGTMIVPRNLLWLSDAMAVVASESFTSVSAPIQYASVAAFQADAEIEAYLTHTRRILRAVGRQVWQILTAANIHALEPVGGFYLLLEFSEHRGRLRRRGISSDEQLCEELLKYTGVALLPGSVFGCPRDELTARLAYVDFDGARALRASETEYRGAALNEQFLKRYCSRMLEAGVKIAAWIMGESVAVIEDDTLRELNVR